MGLKRPAPRAEFARPMLEGLKTQLTGCTRCDLCEQRSQVVFGAGAPTAPVMVIGNRPGYYDDALGSPLSGETAGGIFNQALAEVGLIPRRDIYATYAAKCITPQELREDGQKQRAEVSLEQWAKCRPFLLRQIELIRPAILVLHGKEATKLVLGDDRSMRNYCGQFRKFSERCIALSTHTPGGLFNQRAALIPEYLEHWRQLAYRLNALGRMWRPDAQLFQEGWTFEDPTAPDGTIGATGRVQATEDHAWA